MRSGIRADRRVGLLMAGIVFATFVSIGATIALPASDPDVSADKGARIFEGDAARGMKVYRNEGCWYCHTQAVRNTPIDDVYGKPLAASAYAELSPVLIGLDRIGPDLTHVGGRYGSAEQLIALLRHPRAEGRDSSMPSYSYLSSKDLEALAAYLLALK